MKRYIPLILAGLLTGLIFTGCRDQVPLSAIDRFQLRCEKMGADVRADSLRILAAGDPPTAVFANYELGNSFYRTAGDSAIAIGWDNDLVEGLLDSAEFYFNRAVALDSTFIEALVNLGSLWDDRADQVADQREKHERLVKARELYHRALEIDPTDEKAGCNLGSLHLRQRHTAEALAQFQRVIEQHPKSALARYNLAIMFAESKIYREAIREWELAAKYDPKGDIGARSRENVKIVKELLEAKPPEEVVTDKKPEQKGAADAHEGHDHSR